MTSLVKQEANTPSSMVWSAEQVKLLKDTLCKGASDDEFALFCHVAKKTGLDPFSRQIYYIKRGTNMVFQTAIDGYRLIAERTGRYMPGREPTFAYNKDRQVESATAYVKKLGPDKQWHEIAATAHYDEYVVTHNGKPSAMWNKRHIMLSKCAEALCLRKAFPSDLSGLYTEEEMQQADAQIIEPTRIKSEQQTYVHPIHDLMEACKGDKEWVDKILVHQKIESIEKATPEQFATIMLWAKKKYANAQIAEKTATRRLSDDELPGEPMTKEQLESMMKGE